MSTATKVQIIRFITKYVISLTLFLIVLFPVVQVYASTPTLGTYPTRGFLWMSKDGKYIGTVGVATTKSDPSIESAWTKIKSTTKGSSEMSRWANGIQFTTKNTTGTWNTNVDMLILFTTRYTNSQNQSQGQNYPKPAPKEYCTYFLKNYPCGDRPTVEIDAAWWNKSTAAVREREIIHETGHSGGLADYCGADSIMNNGTATCNGGKWTAVSGYQSTDRQGISNVYPK